tara:strand:- start:1081 stop:1779 length:699 start_codon:yes stop_codon:yes gene_type:complete
MFIKLIFSFFLLLLVNLISGEGQSELRPSKATLTMSAGDMQVWLKKNEGNIWEMGSSVDGGRIFNREETSIFELNDNSLIPLSHKIKMKILFKRINASANFNWENLSLNYQEGKNEGTIQLVEGTLGPATAQLKMRLDLKTMDKDSLPTEMKYFVYFRGEIKERTYLIQGWEEVDTPIGSFNCIKVIRQFSSDEDRDQIYWFAPELDFSIVRIYDRNDRESDLLLKTLEFAD